MGIAGSGLATTLSSILMFVGLAIVVSVERGFRRYHLFGRFWRADWPRFRGLMRLGLPIAGILTFEVWIFNAAALLMGMIGASSLAAHAIAIQIASISFMVPMGISQACTVRVGRAYGAGDPIGITRAGWTAFVLGVSFMALMALTMVLWPRTLISGFIDVGNPGNAEVVGLAVTFLAFAGLFQIVDGAQAVASGMLRGLHDTQVPMVYAAIGYWGDRPAVRRAAGVQVRPCRRRHLDRPVDRPGRGRGAAAGALAAARPARTGVRAGLTPALALPSQPAVGYCFLAAR